MGLLGTTLDRADPDDNSCSGVAMSGAARPETVWNVAVCAAASATNVQPSRSYGPASDVCGLTVLIGAAGIFGNASAAFFGASAAFFGYVPFGPVFGPHIAFAGGVAAVAYAHKRGLANGKDIVAPMITLRRADVLLIGAAFGMVAAWLGEFFARFWHMHGDTHIDPPASAIWIMTTLVLGSAALLS